MHEDDDIPVMKPSFVNKILCVFGCATLCGLRDRFTEKLVFFPPKPATYSFNKDKDNGKEYMHLMDNNGNYIQPSYKHSNLTVGFISSYKQKKIAYLHIAHPDSNLTLIFSHGNATDLGYMRDILLMLARDIKCSILAYDYTGYGLSEGTPNVASIHHNIETIFDLYKQKYKTSKVILYGQSLGTAVSVFLASKNHELDGIVLHSPLLSGLRVMLPNTINKNSYFFDILRNIDLIKEINVPIFIIHGTYDQEVTVEHGLILSEAAKVKYPPFFVEGGSHNNIEIEFRAQYIEKLKEFINYILDQDHQALAINSSNVLLSV